MELTDDVKGYEKEIEHLEREYGIEPIEEHDKQIRAEVIEEYRKEMHDMIDGDDEFTDWQKYEFLECNKQVAEQLKENK